MDQNNAQVGQEASPESNQSVEPKSEGIPASSPTTMENLLKEEGLQLDFPKQGEVRTGVIASIGENEILVSVGTKSEGVISGREKDQIPPEEFVTFEVGKEIPVYVLNPEDQGGNLVLSYLRAREEQDWHTAENFMQSGEAFEGQILGYNKGGLIVPLGNLRGFVPASQVSVMRRAESVGDSPESRWGKMVGENIKVVVIEVDRQRHRLILSERAALQETRETIKERLLDELEEGDIRVGRVTSLADFGAFVNIDGADGLVHLSEISYERIEHPNEVLKVGQEVRVKVITVDHERKRIGLSIRQLLPDPWLLKVENMREGQLVEATITHLTKFGAFARLGEELEGLIHISELSDSRINHPKEVVKEGDVVTLRVIKIEPERRRIGLSLRKVDSPAYADLDWKMALSEEVEGAALASQAPEVEAVEVPAEEAPEEAPVEEAPEPASAEIEEAPTEEAPESVSAEVEEAPVEEAPEPVSAELEEAPVEEAPEPVSAETEEVPVEEAPEPVSAELEEAPTEEAPEPVSAETEEVPLEEAPETVSAEVEEAPVEEAPEPVSAEVEEVPVEEAPEPEVTEAEEAEAQAEDALPEPEAEEEEQKEGLVEAE